MVITDRFAFGHIPRTGGDAVHAYLAAVPGLGATIDDTADKHKHDTFAERRVVREYHLLSIRPLPEWCMSVLADAPHHPWLMAEYGWRAAADAMRPESALRLDADGPLRGFLAGVPPASVRWLRTVSLLADLCEFLASVGVEADADRLRTVPTKPRAGHRPGEFFAPEQIGELRERNPLWAACERAAGV